MEHHQEKQLKIISWNLDLKMLFLLRFNRTRDDVFLVIIGALLFFILFFRHFPSLFLTAHFFLVPGKSKLHQVPYALLMLIVHHILVGLHRQQGIDVGVGGRMRRGGKREEEEGRGRRKDEGRGKRRREEEGGKMREEGLSLSSDM